LDTAAGLIRESLETAATEGIEPRQVIALGVASMAETGLLVDRETGEPRSMFLPWFDTSAMPQAAELSRMEHPKERFPKTGIIPSFKSSLAKILWLREVEGELPHRAVWLSAASYIAYCLTGEMRIDYSLAGRTYAFRIDLKTWDDDYLQRFSLPVNLFPQAQPSVSPVGATRSLPETGLPVGMPVFIAGHDHVCAAFAAGAVEPGTVFDSMGTAETLVGSFGEEPLEQKALESGLAYGVHVVPGKFYWMGGLSASGGSLEWLRALLGDRPLSYEEVEGLLSDMPEGPGDLLYFPYLAGSGSPHADPLVRGAFTGLDASHGKASLLRAVLEGTAYEMEYIRLAAETARGLQISSVVAAGGGTRLRRWMQIKADISGCRLETLATSEATLLGAALVAGLGSGLFSSVQVALEARPASPAIQYLPDMERHKRYKAIFENGYMKLQDPLRRYGKVSLEAHGDGS
jgi:xylulokinase